MSSGRQEGRNLDARAHAHTEVQSTHPTLHRTPKRTPEARRDKAESQNLALREAASAAAVAEARVAGDLAASSARLVSEQERGAQILEAKEKVAAEIRQMEQDLRHARDEAVTALVERDGAKGRTAELEVEALRYKQEIQSSVVQRAASDATATSLKSQLEVATSANRSLEARASELSATVATLGNEGGSMATALAEAEAQITRLESHIEQALAAKVNFNYIPKSGSACLYCY